MAINPNTGDWRDDYEAKTPVDEQDIILIQDSLVTGDQTKRSTVAALLSGIEGSLYPAKVYPDDFGGSSTPGVDNADALEACWADGGHVYFRPGTYEHHRPIKLFDQNGVRWEGPAYGSDQREQSPVVIWGNYAATDENCIWMNRARECTFEFIQFLCEVQPTGNHGGMYIDNDAALGGSTSSGDPYYNTTNLYFRRCKFLFRTGTTNTNAFQLQVGSSTNGANNDMHTFERCEIGSYNSPPGKLVVLDGHNTHAITFNGCQLHGSTSTWAGFYFIVSLGPTFFNNCTFLDLGCIFRMANAMNNGIFVRDCNSERCLQMIRSANAGGEQLMVVSGGRFHPGNVDGTVPFIDYKNAGVFSLRDVYFGNYDAAWGPGELYFKIGGTALNGTNLNVTGCMFPHQNFFTSGADPTVFIDTIDQSQAGCRLTQWDGNIYGSASWQANHHSPPTPVITD